MSNFVVTLFKSINIMVLTISCEGKLNIDIEIFDNQKLEYQKIMILPKSSKNQRFLSIIAKMLLQNQVFAQ